jgi:hypothetical protein
MAEPSAGGLSDLMKTQQRLVEEMLFRTIELTSLVEAGEHRFIGRALDDLERAERELGQAEMVRAAMTEAILGVSEGVEPTLSELLSAVDDDSAATMTTTATQIRRGLAQIEEVRHEAGTTATERVARARRALSAATSEAGLYGRA